MTDTLKTIDALPDGDVVIETVYGYVKPNYRRTGFTTDDLKKLAASVPRWTRVEDGCCYKEGWYLITYEDDDGLQVCPAEMTLGDDHKPQFATVYGFTLKSHQINAWMPLPEPFTEDTDEQR